MPAVTEKIYAYSYMLTCTDVTHSARVQRSSDNLEFN